MVINRWLSNFDGIYSVWFRSYWFNVLICYNGDDIVFDFGYIVCLVVGMNLFLVERFCWCCGGIIVGVIVYGVGFLFIYFNGVGGCCGLFYLKFWFGYVVVYFLGVGGGIFYLFFVFCCLVDLKCVRSNGKLFVWSGCNFVCGFGWLFFYCCCVVG